MRAAPSVTLLVLVLAATACGAGGASGPGSAGGTLTVTVVDAPGAGPRTSTLTCDPPGGDHPRPAEACAAIDATPDPFAPVPPDRACTMIYGGPETATIVGTWRGQRVDAAFRRTDGCEIAHWEVLAAVLGPAGTGS